MGETPAERRGVGLERGVGPVALILQLEVVPLERKARRDTRREVDREFAERPGGGNVHAVHERLRDDLPREDPFGHAGLADRSIAAPFVERREMEHAEADPAVAEGPPGRALHLVGDHAVGVALDAAAPGEIEILRLVPGLEGHGERVFAPVHAHLGRLGRNRVPRLVADGDVDEPRDGRIAARHVCEVDAAKDTADRTRPQSNGRRWCGSPGAAEEVRTARDLRRRGRLGRHGEARLLLVHEAVGTAPPAWPAAVSSAACDRIQRSRTTSR